MSDSPTAPRPPGANHLHPTDDAPRRQPPQHTPDPPETLDELAADSAPEEAPAPGAPAAPRPVRPARGRRVPRPKSTGKVPKRGRRKKGN
jgi:hypothetical protein